MKIAFFDRDGTVIEDFPDHRWTNVTYPVFIKGSIETLKVVNQMGYEIIIITNQYLINEGFITLKQYKDITTKMTNELSCHDIRILDIFHCPHGREEGCHCIKPQTGMIRDALQKYPSIDIDQSFMIGDSHVDIELSIAMNMKGFGIRVGSSYRNEKIHELSDIKDLLAYL